MRTGVIHVRVAGEDELDVTPVEAERGDVGLQERHGVVEGRVHEDVSGRRSDEVRTDAAQADVIDVPQDPKRRKRRFP